MLSSALSVIKTMFKMLKFLWMKQRLSLLQHPKIIWAQSRLQRINWSKDGLPITVKKISHKKQNCHQKTMKTEDDKKCWREPAKLALRKFTKEENVSKRSRNWKNKKKGKKLLQMLIFLFIARNAMRMKKSWRVTYSKS